MNINHFSYTFYRLHDHPFATFFIYYGNSSKNRKFLSDTTIVKISQLSSKEQPRSSSSQVIQRSKLHGG
jgi:hypothetical protein